MARGIAATLTGLVDAFERWRPDVVLLLGDRVAVLSENRPEYVELELAVAKLGAVLVPGAEDDPGLRKPVFAWVPSIATAGMTFYTGDRFPEWRGDAFVGGLKSQQLVRLRIDGDRLKISGHAVLTVTGQVHV